MWLSADFVTLPSFRALQRTTIIQLGLGAGSKRVLGNAFEELGYAMLKADKALG